MISQTMLVSVAIEENISLMTQIKKIFGSVKSSCPSDCEIMFPAVRPSLAIQFITKDESYGTQLQSLTKLQMKFRNAHAILIDLTEDQNDLLVSNLPPGCLRMFRSSCSQSDIANTIKLCFESVFDDDGFKKQISYFQNLEFALFNDAAARSIAHNYLMHVDIPVAEEKLLFDSAPSLAAIVLSSKGKLQQICPIDSKYISKLCDSFDFKK